MQCKRAGKDVISPKAKETCKATNNGNFITPSEEKPDPREYQQVKTVTSARAVHPAVTKAVETSPERGNH